MKSQKCIVFPKSQYVISSSALDTKENYPTKYYCMRSQISMFPFNKGWSTQNTTLACCINFWDRIFFFSWRSFYSSHSGFFSFLLFYAHLIRNVTVGNLHLINVAWKEENMNEVAHIKKMLCCVKKELWFIVLL